MSKHFAMLNAARRLENHLSRENYNLNRMAENDRIPHSLFKTKVGHHNELVDALNELFASLADSPSSELFARYILHDASEIGDEPEISFIPGNVTEEPSAPVEQEAFDDRVVAVPEIEEPETETTESSEEPDTAESDTAENDVQMEPSWESDGYATYEAWLADKDTEYAQSPDDLSLSVNDAMSRHRAEQALNEYNETSERDVATYLPEDDSPANVLPTEDEDEESEEGEVSATDYNYLDHTVDNVRVDSDPTQIAGVETAVERYGENARKGTDIDVSSFIYQSGSSNVDDLISDDIDQLHAPETTSTESDV